MGSNSAVGTALIKLSIDGKPNISLQCSTKFLKSFLQIDPVGVVEGLGNISLHVCSTKFLRSFLHMEPVGFNLI